MKVSDLKYDIPSNLIANFPIEKRESSRLMVVNRRSGGITHHTFSDITDYLNHEDILVLNDTRVFPARLMGRKNGRGARIELLLLKEIKAHTWEALIKPGKRVSPGTYITFAEGVLQGEILKKVSGGRVLVRFNADSPIIGLLEKYGSVPIPPYIKRTGKEKALEFLDRERYQTVYARKTGAVAAPTAGLHFSHSLLEKINNTCSGIAYVTLHVGAGTFKPVTCEYARWHRMEWEEFKIEKWEAEKINRVKEMGGKVFSVGSTTSRVLETVSDNKGCTTEAQGLTNLFIYPGYCFRAIDALITNFHLPESSLLLLVSAFAGVDLIRKAYSIAVQEGYRFYSYGDAMLIL